jgi:hypothetical protein
MDSLLFDVARTLVDADDHIFASQLVPRRLFIPALQ